MKKNGLFADAKLMKNEAKTIFIVQKCLNLGLHNTIKPPHTQSMKLEHIAIACIAPICFAGLYCCKSASEATDPGTVKTVTPRGPAGIKSNILPGSHAPSGTLRASLPHAVIYRTNGDWDKYVSITLNTQGTAPVSFPDPCDVGGQSVPIHLEDGWLLDRRGGIGPNTVFLDYTYTQYHALEHVPDIDTLMARIIPGARVLETRRLPLPANPADTAAVNKLIRSGLPSPELVIP